MKPEQDGQRMIVSALSQMDRKIKLVEERVTGLRNHIELIENNLIETNQKLVQEAEDFNKTAQDLRKQMQENLDQLNKISEHINNFASKDSVKVIERYMEIINPLSIMNKEDVEELIEVKISNKEE